MESTSTVEVVGWYACAGNAWVSNDRGPEKSSGGKGSSCGRLGKAVRHMSGLLHSRHQNVGPAKLFLLGALGFAAGAMLGYIFMGTVHAVSVMYPLRLSIEMKGNI